MCVLGIDFTELVTVINKAVVPSSERNRTQTNSVCQQRHVVLNYIKSLCKLFLLFLWLDAKIRVHYVFTLLRHLHLPSDSAQFARSETFQRRNKKLKIVQKLC